MGVKEFVVGGRPLDRKLGKVVGHQRTQEAHRVVHEALDGFDGEVRATAMDADGKVHVWAGVPEQPDFDRNAYRRGWERTFGNKEN